MARPSRHDLFNVVVVVTHTPVVVNAALERVAPPRFTLIFVSSIIVWLPLLSPLPEVPRLAPLVRMLFLFLQSIIPVPSFLTLARGRCTPMTMSAPVRPLGARGHADRQVIMKIGVGLTCG